MNAFDDEPQDLDGYRLKDLERRIAEDDEAAELGVHVVRSGDRLFVRGHVASAARRERVLELVRQECPEIEAVDELHCVDRELSIEPGAAEVLR
jgi:hypothetical protein